MSPDFIIDVNELDFEYEVISYSKSTPVVVDFWAQWCRPCKTLSPIMEKLAVEGQGQFRLAKVNVDENPNLALRFNIRSIPTVKSFIDGQVTDEFLGLQPENRIRDFLGKLVPPSPAKLAQEKAQSLLSLHEWSEAEKIFRELREQSPEDPVVTLGLIKALLAQGYVTEPVFLLNSFPPSPQYSEAEKLRPYAKALSDYEKNSLPDDTDLDATFRNSIRLAKLSNYESALDGMLDIMRQNKRYRNDTLRLIIIGLLSIMGEEDPLTRQYRSELAAILF